MRALVVLVVLVSGCGSKQAACVEGQSASCACPDGTQGAQVCTASGAFGTCTCSRGSAGAAAGSAVAPVATACTLEGLRCNELELAGADHDRQVIVRRAGWKLHELVYGARKAKRNAEAIC